MKKNPRKINKEETVILGAGVTGLAAGFASDLPVYEAQEVAGGICSSYYIKKTASKKLQEPPKDAEAYHFEIGGGHWIFGGDPVVVKLINDLAPCKTYTRSASIYLPKENIFVPYPIQNHLRFLKSETREKALSEMTENARREKDVRTMGEWLEKSFGKTLCDLFFYPFHEMYTAGIWKDITPQDSYKSPVDLKLATKGAREESNAVGYNTTFIYPKDGLNTLVKGLARRQKIRYGKKVTQIDIKKKIIYFEKSTPTQYKQIISTLPLNKIVQLTGIDVGEKAHPSPAILVLNIGAEKGVNCPKDHWVYIPESKAGFHRVGFYSNVDESFLPLSERGKGKKVGIYVEKAYKENSKIDQEELELYTQETIKELQEWGWIKKVDVADPTWIDVAYTWSWPQSKWKEKSLKALQDNDIYQVGRFGRWVFQGISDSIRDGLAAGAAFKKTSAKRR